MDDAQHDPRAAGGTGTEHTDEVRTPTASAVPLARLLANPWRIRRS